MSNKELAKAFKLTAQLMELHDENPFKIRSIQNAAFKLERHPVPIETLDPNEIGSIDGVGKVFRQKLLIYSQRIPFLKWMKCSNSLPKE